MFWEKCCRINDSDDERVLCWCLQNKASVYVLWYMTLLWVPSYWISLPSESLRMAIFREVFKYRDNQGYFTTQVRTTAKYSERSPYILWILFELFQLLQYIGAEDWHLKLIRVQYVLTSFFSILYTWRL